MDMKNVSQKLNHATPKDNTVIIPLNRDITQGFQTLHDELLKDSRITSMSIASSLPTAIGSRNLA